MEIYFAWGARFSTSASKVAHFLAVFFNNYSAVLKYHTEYKGENNSSLMPNLILVSDILW